MSDDVRADLRRRLAEVEQRLTSLTAQGTEMRSASEQTNADDEHDPEGATIGFERAQLDAVTSGLRRTADQLRSALDRIDDGRYGLCEVCGEPIPEARLLARPQATTCVTHA